jgi:hypothetical protein
MLSGPVPRVTTAAAKASGIGMVEVDGSVAPDLAETSL